jgi:thiol:disulfide interchange protein DsbD
MVRSRARSCAAAAAALLAFGSGIAGADDPKLLPNERAFAFSARGIDERTVEARFVIADGYYLYRDKLRFTAEPAAAAPALPPGKIKEDQFFGKVETSGTNVEAATRGGSLTADRDGACGSQGCADLGVCCRRKSERDTITLVAGAGGGVLSSSAAEKSGCNEVQPPALPTAHDRS